MDDPCGAAPLTGPALLPRPLDQGANRASQKLSSPALCAAWLVVQTSVSAANPHAGVRTGRLLRSPVWAMIAMDNGVVALYNESLRRHWSFMRLNNLGGVFGFSERLVGERGRRKRQGKGATMAETVEQLLRIYAQQTKNLDDPDEPTNETLLVLVTRDGFEQYVLSEKQQQRLVLIRR